MIVTLRIALAVRLLMLGYSLMPAGKSKADLREKLSAFMDNELTRCGAKLASLRSRRAA